MKFIVKYLRLIWSGLFEFIFLAITVFQLIFFKSKREIYNANKGKWNSIKSVEDLNNYYKTISYKSDGPSGVIDHDNSNLEFFATGGDCDDMGEYSKNKLKELGFVAHRIFIQGQNIFSMHFDCLFIAKDEYYLFNYGSNKLINKYDLKESLLSTLNALYKSSTFKFFDKEYPIQFKDWFYLD